MNWPKIPEYFLDDIYKLVSKDNAINAQTFWFEQPNVDWKTSLAVNASMTSTINQNLGIIRTATVIEPVPKNLKNWLKQNIPIKFDFAHVVGLIDGTSLLPHVDGLRMIGYNYVIHSDAKSKTCFYEPKKEYSHLVPYPDTDILHDRLELVYEEVVKFQSWYKINTKKIHSVENLANPGKRIAISLSIIR